MKTRLIDSKLHEHQAVGGVMSWVPVKEPKCITRYNKIFKELCEEFAIKYFSEEEDGEVYVGDYYIIGEGGSLAPGVVSFQEYYHLNIDTIYECLIYDIPFKVRSDRYDYSCERCGKGETHTNITSYYFGAPTITENEKKESEERLKDSAKIFCEALGIEPAILEKEFDILIRNT